MTRAKRTTSTTPGRIDRQAHLRWVAVADVHTSPLAQRDMRESWAAKIAQDFDPDRFTYPVLSHRDGKLYCVDGQHRFRAMHLMGWDDQQVQCLVYEGLTEAQEAELFLYLNRRLNVTAFDEFRIAVTAGWPEEVDIERTVLLLGLRISKDRGGIRAVGALRKVYDLGPLILSRALRVIRDAYGELGFRSEIITGVGLLCERYGDMIDEDRLVDRLQSAHGGMFGMLTAARGTKRQLGRPLAHCVASTMVDVINTGGRGGKRIPSWWSTT